MTTTPKTLDSEQCVKLLNELMVVNGTERQISKGCRNYGMAMLMLETGLRVAEACALKISDLWFLDEPVDTVCVREQVAKNGEERQIPVSEKLCESIKEMHAILWSTDSGDLKGYAFFMSDPKKPLSTRTVERVILAAGKASCNREVTPHMLRHTFGTNMMRKTNARNVQELLGHANLQTTQIYMNPNLNDLRKAIESKDEPMDFDYR